MKKKYKINTRLYVARSQVRHKKTRHCRGERERERDY